MKNAQAQLSLKDFHKLSSFIYSNYGIKLPPTKKIMLESRLQKRLAVLGISTYSAYCEFLFSREGQQQELIPMIDLVTTNKTDFFREEAHFDFLSRQVLPEYAQKQGLHSPLKIWSAACSSGEEPYSIAMCLQEFAHATPLNYSILGTDISSEILRKAEKGVYDEDRLAKVPLHIKKKYFLRGKEGSIGKVKVAPEIRSGITFKRLNLMDKTYDLGQTFHMIFCRNVLIYFNKPTQEAVINKLAANLKTGGYFFLGHSESISNMKVPLQQTLPTIFRKI